MKHFEMPKPPYLGAAYYPEDWDDDQIDVDVAKMVELGLKVVRIGEFAWHRMEPKPGEFDFTFFHTVIDKLKAGFSDGVSYDDLASRLLMNDEYMLLQDFASYCAAEQRMADTYARSEEWNRMSLINIARSGIFAADRAVAQYADTIWHVEHK